VAASKRRKRTPGADPEFLKNWTTFVRRFDELTLQTIASGRWPEVQRVHGMLIGAMDGASRGVQCLAILHLALQAVGQMLDAPHLPGCACREDEDDDV